MAYPLNSNTRPTDPYKGDPARTYDLNPLPPTAVPAVGDLTAGDGAARAERLTPKTSGYSTNVPQPDNKGPVRDGGDGKDGMAG